MNTKDTPTVTYTPDQFSPIHNYIPHWGDCYFPMIADNPERAGYYFSSAVYVLQELRANPIPFPSEISPFLRFPSDWNYSCYVWYWDGKYWRASCDGVIATVQNRYWFGLNYDPSSK